MRQHQTTGPKIIRNRTFRRLIIECPSGIRLVSRAIPMSLSRQSCGLFQLNKFIEFGVPVVVKGATHAFAQFRESKWFFDNRDFYP